MAATTIKRGATFEAYAVLTENEWDGLWPWDSVEAAIGQAGQKLELTVQVDEDTRTLFMFGPTDTLRPGPAQFDFKVVKGGKAVSIPGDHNIPLSIIDGVA